MFTSQPAESLTRAAISATLHCLTGCAIGEILGLVLATWWGLANGLSIALSVVLAFFFGYLLSMLPLLRSGLPLRKAVRIALAADTLSILTMEIVDSAVVLAVPGAMDAGLTDALVLGQPCWSARCRLRCDRPGEPRAHRPWQRTRSRSSVPSLSAHGDFRTR